MKLPRIKLRKARPGPREAVNDVLRDAYKAGYSLECMTAALEYHLRWAKTCAMLMSDEPMEPRPAIYDGITVACSGTSHRLCAGCLCLCHTAPPFSEQSPFNMDAGYI